MGPLHDRPQQMDSLAVEMNLTRKAEEGQSVGSRAVTLIAAASAFIGGGLGVFALVGWWLKIPALSSFGSDKIPMAPSTALFFILNFAGVLALVTPLSFKLRRYLFFPPVALATLVSSLILPFALHGLYSPLEYLGFNIGGVLNGAPLGHMSPLTALCFILGGTALGVLLWEPARSFRPWWWGVLTPAAFLGLLSFTLLLAYLLGAPILWGSGLIPPDLPTSLAFFMLALSLQILAAQRLWPLGRWPELEELRALFALILIFVVLIGGVAATFFLSFRDHEQEHRATMALQLRAISELKVERVVSWLREYQVNGEELANNHGFADRVEQWLRHDSAENRRMVEQRLDDLRSRYGLCGIVLLDGQGKVLYRQGVELDAALPLNHLVDQARREKVPVVSDLFQTPEGAVHLCWVVPILPGVGDGPPLAFVVRFLNAADFLFPFLTFWPGESESAQTLLVRREGEHAMVLNNTRSNPNSAFKLRFPLEQKDNPAVEAVLGREGLLEGLDHRGTPVVAVVGQVPGTSWSLVTTMTMAEVYAPLRARLWVIVLAILLLILSAAGGVGLLWHRQLQARDYTLLARDARRDREMRIELQRQVAQRTAQLSALNKELEAFSYSVSHDLKAPLRGVAGYSRLLERNYLDKLDDEGRLFLGNIKQGVEEMGRMIDGLLTYSRMERQLMQPRGVDLDALIEAVLEGFQHQLSAADVQVEMKVPPLKVKADPEGLRLVLRNLIDNAIKFSRDSKPPRLTLTARRDGELVHLRVEDNGIGFEQKLAGRVFKIFSRLVKEDEFPGSGVGMALVRKAVERMNGRIRAESAPGKGTTFFLEIPGYEEGAKEE